MKFDDIVFLVQTGGSIAAAAGANPLLVASLDAGARLIKLGRDAYQSGRDRGEWTPEQVAHFDTVVLPAITSQPHWQNPPEEKAQTLKS